MSKPAPIEYSLSKWNIRYDSTPYENSSQTGTKHYEAVVTWTAKVGENQSVIHKTKHFVKFEDARAWIDAGDELMGARQKSAKDKVKWLKRGGFKDANIAMVTKYLRKRKKGL